MSGFSIDHIKRAVESVNKSGLGAFMHQDPFSNERRTSRKRRTSRNNVVRAECGGPQEIFDALAECSDFKKYTAHKQSSRNFKKHLDHEQIAANFKRCVEHE